MRELNSEDKKVFKVELTGLQIAIIKASLRYFQLDDDFGYALWRTMPGATVCGHDREYAYMSGDIYKKLEELTKIEADYSYWGNIDRLGKLCDKEYEKAKKEGEEAEKQLYEEYLISSSIEDVANKYGLSGSKVLKEVYESASKKRKENGK